MTDMNTDNDNNNPNIDILNVRNNYVLTDIFNKHFDEEKHVPILYLVLDLDTLKDNGLIDVKLLMLLKPNKNKK